jgi:hypothetical protein
MYKDKNLSFKFGLNFEFVILKFPNCKKRKKKTQINFEINNQDKLFTQDLNLQPYKVCAFITGLLFVYIGDFTKRTSTYYVARFSPFVTQNPTNPYVLTMVRNKSLTPLPPRALRPLTRRII